MRFAHGSLINCLADNTPVKADPKVGDGATVVAWSDRHAATVTDVRKTASGKLVVTVQADKATRTDGNGMSDSQSYSYEPDPNGRTYTFSQRKDGVLREKGSNGGYTLWLGCRDEYYDYSF